MKTYEGFWCNAYLTDQAGSVEEMGEMLISRGEHLARMAADGVVLALSRSDMENDHACLQTTDAAVADKYGMEEQSEDGPPLLIS